MSHPQPPMSTCRSATAASLALNRRKKVYHLRFSARYGRRLPEHIRFLRCKSGIGLLRRADTRLRPQQKPMLNKLSGNAYGSPAHTLALHSLATLPTLYRTSPCIFRSAQGQVEDTLRRPSGAVYTEKRASPRTHKLLNISDIFLSILYKW